MSTLRAEKIGTPDGNFTGNVDGIIGKWSGDVIYNKYNAVIEDGEFYVCKTNNHVSITPPSQDPANWDKKSEIASGSIVSVKDFGATGGGTVDDGPYFQDAVESLHSSGGGILIVPPGTYKISTAATVVNVEGVSIIGAGTPIIDFQVGGAFTFGDFTTDVNGYFTQTTPTVKDMNISGIKFIPVSGSGWDGSQYAYANCIKLSAAENVTVSNCYFKDQHVGAVDIAAKSTNVTVNNCVFESTEEAPSTYGVRPFCYVAPLDAFDEVTGQLLYPAPTVFHEYITVKNCKFYNIGRSIVSWNVHNSKYVDNYFYKPTVRSISVTNWNFNSLVRGNTHVAVNNTISTLSTFVNIGTGSENILIEGEQFTGEMSGNVPNANLKCVHSNSYSRNVTIQDCDFNTTKPEAHIVITANSEVCVKDNTFNGLLGDGKHIDITGGLSTTYDQPNTIIDSNLFRVGNRCVIISRENSNGTGVVRFTNNTMNEIQAAGMIAFATGTVGWILDMFNNKFPKGGYVYVNNNGGSYTVERQDTFDDKLLHNIQTGTDTTLTIDYRLYHGKNFFIQPDAGVSLTLEDVQNAEYGLHITIISGGSEVGGNVTIPEGIKFKNISESDLILVSNETASYVRRDGVWCQL